MELEAIETTVTEDGDLTLSGTSMAAPLVAGAAALVKARYPDADAAELKERLLRSVDRVPAAAGKVSTGGRLNLYRALTD